MVGPINYVTTSHHLFSYSHTQLLSTSNTTTETNRVASSQTTSFLFNSISPYSETTSSMVIIDKYSVGLTTLVSIVTTLVCIIYYSFLFTSHRRRRLNANKSVTDGIGTETVRTTECRSESETDADVDDVIIVGAGVAGAALAYTLGKVNSIIIVY